MQKVARWPDPRHGELGTIIPLNANPPRTTTNNKVQGQDIFLARRTHLELGLGGHTGERGWLGRVLFEVSS